jgi:tetratricopeptide (TPR) repeat protein
MKVRIRKLTLAAWLIVLFAVAPSAQESLSPIKAGNKLYAEKQYGLAIKEYQRVPEKDESYATAIYNIGVCEYELWRTEEAIEFYRQAIKLKRGNYWKASFALAIALEEENHFAEAKEAYIQSIRASPNENPWAKFKLGLLEANEGELEFAARLFREASARSGEHVASSHNNLGVMLARMGRLSEAEKEFGIAVKQSRGSITEAEHNLQLCRSLLATAENRDTIEKLKLSLPTFFR